MKIESEKPLEIQTFPAETLVNTSPEFLGEETLAKIWDAFGDFQQKRSGTASKAPSSYEDSE